MKKFLTLLLTAILAVACCCGLTACGNNQDNGDKVKIGLICLHDDNSTYDKNFIDAMKLACAAKNAQLILKTNIDESAACTDAAKNLASQGCKAVFADSFGHQDYMIEAAKAYPDVQFCHATGFKAKSEGQANFHNAFADIYEGRYLAGYTAGMKLAQMVKDNQVGTITAGEVKELKIGYVGAFTYAEVISGFTSWYLGVKAGFNELGTTIIGDTFSAANFNITLTVKFTGSWYDETAERNAALDLIENSHCILISQHADSWGAPKACEEKGVPNVSYNGSTASQCPNTFLVSSKINWQPYFEYMIDGVTVEGATISTDYTNGFGNMYDGKAGSVMLTEFGKNVYKDSANCISKVAMELGLGERYVFDCTTFTVGGKTLSNNNALTESEQATLLYNQYCEEVTNTKTNTSVLIFGESNIVDFVSAPGFDLQIDGITYINTKF